LYDALLTCTWASTQIKGLRYHKLFLFKKKNWQHFPYMKRLSKIFKPANTQQFKFNCHKPIDFIQFVSLSLSEEFTQLVLNLVFKIIIFNFLIHIFIIEQT
jgi:hypothetical protein